MTSADYPLFVGVLFASWSSGFVAGYLMTKYKNIIDAI